jgi:hypothetical protein
MHSHVRCVHGDEINQSARYLGNQFARAACVRCGKYLYHIDLPYMCDYTGTPHFSKQPKEFTEGADMPRKYRLIPVSVEAIQLTPESVKRAALWCGGVEVEEIDPHDSTKKFVALNIPTLSGVKRAGEGDYVIKGLQGEFSVMNSTDFETRYELVEP